VINMIGCTNPHAIAAKVTELAGEDAEAARDDPSCGCHSSPAMSPAAIPVALSVSACGCVGPCPEDVPAASEPPAVALSSCRFNGSCSETNQEPSVTATRTIIQAQPPNRIELDRAGYFVVIPQRERGIIVIEHYSYDDTLLRSIEGHDARSIYWTIISNDWVSQLSHAAYLGKELAKAELALTIGFKYVQDGA
jgi:hypothetical protein